MICPSCGSTHVHRSSTRWQERPRRWLTMTAPLRCRDCDHRWWPKAARARGAAPKVREPKTKFNDRDIALGAMLVIVLLAIVAGLLLMLARAEWTGRQGVRIETDAVLVEVNRLL